MTTAAVSSVGALTTTFTPASSCTIDVTRFNYPGITCAIGTTPVPCYYYHLGVDSSTAACWPSGWSDATAAYFSPGVCPQGYTEACSSVVGAETRATCCPSGYSCQASSNWPWYTTDICSFTMTTQETFVYTTSIIGEGLVTTTVTDQQGINAFGLRIRYQSTDFASSTTAGPTAGSGATSSKSDSSSPVETQSDSGGEDSGGLSSGAKAGIGIGVALGVLLLAAAGAFVFWRRRRAATGGAQAARAFGGLPAEVSADGVMPTEQKYYYVTSTPIAEAPTNGPPVELPANHR